MAVELSKEDLRKKINLRKESDAYGATLREFRMKQMDMTQEEFADMMGVSVSTLRNWEQGSTPVPTYFMRAIVVMSLNPTAAMAELDTYLCVEGAQETWTDIAASGPSNHARAVAIERIKNSEFKSRAMDVLDEIFELKREMDQLGGRYANMSIDTLMRLCEMVVMDRMNGNVETMKETCQDGE